MIISTKGIQQGFADGANQNKLETARNLTEMGFAVEVIAKATGLSIEESPYKKAHFYSFISSKLILNSSRSFSLIISSSMRLKTGLKAASIISFLALSSSKPRVIR